MAACLRFRFRSGFAESDLNQQPDERRFVPTAIAERLTTEQDLTEDQRQITVIRA